MRVVVIGATGTVGAAVVAALRARHEVIGVSRGGRPAVDLRDLDTIGALFADVSAVDAVVCCAASVPLMPLGEIDAQRPEDRCYAKLFGQIALVRVAAEHLNDGGSVAVTSGTFAAPVLGSALGAMTNAGLDAFVASAAPELPRHMRVNAVAPGWVAESLQATGMDPASGTPAATVAGAYVRAVEGAMTGESLKPG